MSLPLNFTPSRETIARAPALPRSIPSTEALIAAPPFCWPWPWPWPPDLPAFMPGGEAVLGPDPAADLAPAAERSATCGRRGLRPDLLWDIALPDPLAARLEIGPGPVCRPRGDGLRRPPKGHAAASLWAIHSRSASSLIRMARPAR